MKSQHLALNASVLAEAPNWSTESTEDLLVRIDTHALPAAYVPARHQDHGDKRIEGMTPGQRGRLGFLWREKQRLHPDMENRGRSFIRILEYVAGEPGAGNEGRRQGSRYDSAGMIDRRVLHRRLPAMSHLSRFSAGAIAASALLFVSHSLGAESTPIQVFILAGQSNMEGQGVVSMDHPKYYNGGKGNLVWSMAHSKSRERMKHLRDEAGNWVEREDVTISYEARDEVRKGKLTVGFTGYGGSSHIGPELQFGHVLGDHFDEPVLLIKTAWGGKSLHKDFRPPSSGGEVGPYYRQMIEEVRAALAALGDASFQLRGFVWMQGWNDMISKEATAEYAANLVNLARDVREEFRAPRLPIVIGELGNGGPAREGSGMETFRRAQRAGTGEIPHALFVPTAGFARPKELSPNVGHGHHWFGNAESYFLVGEALGEGMKKLLGD